MARLPGDAFDQYVALGAGRTYEALAGRLGVSKRTIVRHATEERWQDRLARIEAAARTRADEKLADSLSAINDRHLRTLRAVQAKSLQALAGAPTGTASQASATLIAAVRAERAIVSPGSEKGPQEKTLSQIIEEASSYTEEEVKAMHEALAAVRAKTTAAETPPEPPVPTRGGLLPPGEN